MTKKLSRLGFIWFFFQELIYNFYSDYVNIEYDRVYKILQKYLKNLFIYLKNCFTKLPNY